MGTSGSSRSSGRSSGRSRSAGSAGAKRSAASRSSASRAPSRHSRGDTLDLTPPESRGGNDQAGSRHRLIHNRDELIGVIVIFVGILLGLAIYFDLAGPLGRGIDTVLAWFCGLGRYLIPLLLGAVGVAFIARHRSSSLQRLLIGWGMILLAVLGILHLAWGSDGFGVDTSAYGGGGGIFGAIVAEPLSAIVATAGASVVLLLVAIGGALLITSTSLRTMAQRTGRGVVQVAGPIGRATRRAVAELSSLSSERRARAEEDDDGDERAPAVGRTTPELYDFAAEGDDPAVAERGRRDEPRAPRAKASAKRAASPVATTPGEWVLPDASALVRSAKHTVNRSAVEARGETLQESLAQHGVDTTLVGMTVGPTVTRYELELGPGVKVARVTSLQRDIAYAMAATDVRILAPIPGRSAIGVEVPNSDRQLVALGDLLHAPEAADATHPLDVAIGKDIAGRAVFLNLATTPHLLIAGATGAGKSSGLNCIITSLLMRSTPDQVRLILIDPKQVEMGQYQRLPHLLTQPVTDPKKAANALGWAVKEMERRYDILSTVGVRDISSYNEAYDLDQLPAPPALLRPDDDAEPPTWERLPYIVVVVDELNDLMMVAARDVEDSITRIAQKARAVGIHLIVATQRPSVNVITGVIKANIPARIAFAVSSQTDSRVILDQPGAEKLVGRGDMLLLPGSSSVAQRIQGSFVSEAEVRTVVEHWRAQAPVVESSNARPLDAAPGIDDVVTAGSTAFADDVGDEDAAMMRQAMELVVRSQLGSTSMLQRKLKVGFARAGRIMDLLEQRGVVGPSEGSKAREVLMTVEEFELLAANDRS